jgi:tetratricopeptide (TPR) repeat protein
MSELYRTSLTPEQLIEFENICDAFESSLNQGKPAEIESIVENAHPELRQSLRVALNTVFQEFIQRSSSQTRTGDSKTLSPDDFLFQTERIFDFSAPQQDAADHPKTKLTTQSFGRFRLHSIVGRGGSGVVWRAFDGNLDRWVALKIAHEHSVTDSKRFVREAQAVAKLKHPNIIPVFEAGELDGRCFLVGEFCEGQPLSQMIQGRSLETAFAIDLVLPIIDAISHSHRHGIVHRDIKPQNIMIDNADRPLLTDFGLAKNLIQDQTLTVAGELIGTPGYMSPEQAKGGAQNCDERTDIYSIGVVLFQLLTGQLPFSGGFERIVFQVIHSAPPRLRALKRELPPELETVCAKCLEKSPKLRYQTAEELGKELRRFLDGKPIETQTVTLTGRYLRWLKREPRVAWATTACTLLLLTVAIGSTISASMLAVAWRSEKKQVAAEVVARQEATQAKTRAEQAELLAQRNEQRAQNKAKASRAEANFLSSVFAPADMMGVNQVLSVRENRSQLLSEKIIVNANRQADHLLAETPLARSRVKGMLANAWRSHGQLDKAESLLKESTRLLEQNSSTVDTSLLSDQAMNQLYWAYLLHHREEIEESSDHYQSAIKLFRQINDKIPASPICELQLAQAEFGLGALLLKQKRNAEAKVYLKRVLHTRRRLLGKHDSLLLATELAFLQCDPKNSLKELPAVLQSVDQDIAQKVMTLYWEVVAARKVGEFETATAKYRQLILLVRNEVGENNWLYTLAIGDFANLQREAGNYSLAYSNARDAIDRGKAFARWHPQRMRAMLLMAFELKLANRYREARELLLEVAEHESPNWSESVALHSDLAWCHYHLREPELALERSRLPLRIIGTCTAFETAWHQYTHATMLAANGRQSEANEMFDKANVVVVSLVRDAGLPKHSTWLKRTGLVLTHAGEDSLAEQVFRRAIEFAETEFFADHPRVADIKMLLAQNLIQQGQHERAKLILEQASAIHSKCLSADDKRHQQIRRLMESVADSTD